MASTESNPVHARERVCLSITTLAGPQSDKVDVLVARAKKNIILPLPQMQNWFIKQ
jgi:hypothetical protein